MIEPVEERDGIFPASVDLTEEDSFEFTGLHAGDTRRVKVVNREALPSSRSTKCLALPPDAPAIAKELWL